MDSNVLLDIVNDDPEWSTWSVETLEREGAVATLAVNPIILAEVSIQFESPVSMDLAFPQTVFRRLPLPFDAAFVAGASPLPDFFIGAHAQVENLTLITRERARFSTYFPHVRLIAPK